MIFINFRFMKFFTSKYTLLLLVVIGFGMMTSCKKGGNTGTVQEQVDSLKVGLIAYYPFNNSGVDESGNGNHGMVYNISSVPDRNSKPNYAYHFDGATSYITVPDNQALRLSNADFTVSAWTKLDAVGGGIILAKRIQGDITGWSWSIGNNQIYFGPGSNAPNATAPATINVNQWYMVTCVYTLSTHTVNVYLNGALIKTASGIASPGAATTPTLYMGRDNPNTTGVNYIFQGSMDDVRIYGRALTLAQIQKLYTLTY